MSRDTDPGPNAPRTHAVSASSCPPCSNHVVKCRSVRSAAAVGASTVPWGCSTGAGASSAAAPPPQAPSARAHSSGATIPRAWRTSGDLPRPSMRALQGRSAERARSLKRDLDRQDGDQAERKPATSSSARRRNFRRCGRGPVQDAGLDRRRRRSCARRATASTSTACLRPCAQVPAFAIAVLQRVGEVLGVAADRHEAVLVGDDCRRTGRGTAPCLRSRRRPRPPGSRPRTASSAG